MFYKIVAITLIASLTSVEATAFLPKAFHALNQQSVIVPSTADMTRPLLPRLPSEMNNGLVSKLNFTKLDGVRDSDVVPATNRYVGTVGTILYNINTPWDWYVPQGGWYKADYTRASSPTNGNDCGPASVAMILRLLSQGSIKDLPHEVRSRLDSTRDKNNYTSTNDLIGMLNAYNVNVISRINPNAPQNTGNLEGVIEDSIAAGKPIIAVLQMSSISRGSDYTPTYCKDGNCQNSEGVSVQFSRLSSLRTGRYYEYSGGHWLVIKGIGTIAGVKHAIVYDPNVWLGNNSFRYFYDAEGDLDLSLAKGLDRWYPLTEVAQGMKANGAESIIIDRLNNIPMMPPTSYPLLASQKETANTGAVATSNIGAIQQITHISIPPGMHLQPSVPTVKEWLVSNIGSSRLMQGIVMKQIGGPAIETAGLTYAPEMIPGTSRNLKMVFYTPRDPGSYVTSWQLQDLNGNLVNGTLDLSFVVDGAPLQSTPTPIPTAVPPPASNGLQLELLQSAPSTVLPGQSFNVRVKVNVLSGQLSQARGDMLRPVDSSQYQAFPHQAVYGTITANGSFIFGDQDPFTLVAPSASGNYTSKWRMWVAGAWVGPEISIPFNVGSPPPPPTKPSGWRAQFWNGYYNENPWGNARCKTEENTDSIPFTKNWGTGGPGGGCSSGKFSVLFERQFEMKAGLHRFHCHRDSYCRIFITNLGSSAPEDGGAFGGMDWTVNIPSDGTYEVKVEYSHNEKNGPSRLEFWWQGSTEDYLPPYSWDDSACDIQPYQWCGRYRLTKDSPGDSVPWRKFEGDGFLDKSWSDSPGYGINSDFAASWKRKLNVPAGLYRFYMEHDDGAQLTVNGQRIIDQWSSCCQTHQADVWLNSGDNQIDVNWFDGGYNASIKVRWEALQLCTMLSTAAIPANAGTVGVSPAPDCDRGTRYKPDTTVTLVANPSGNGIFAGWGGDVTGTVRSVNVQMNANKRADAYFDTCYTLITNVSLVGAGSIATNPPPNCQGNKYRSGTAVNVLAVTNAGYGFTGWSGVISATWSSIISATVINPLPIVMTGDINLTANHVQYAASISTLAPLPPYCVIVNTNYAPDRMLDITGSGFDSTKHSWQFQRVSDGTTYGLFAGEIVWVDATHARLDVDRVKGFFSSVSGAALMRLRLTHNTSGGYTPVSDWSTPFLLTQDEAACGLSRKPIETPTPPPIATTPAPTQTASPKPSANFDAWPQIGKAPLVVEMHIVSADNISTCAWEYGDGQTGNSCSPYHYHTYANSGTYTVKLTVSGTGGSDTLTRTNYILVSSPALTATTPAPCVNCGPANTLWPGYQRNNAHTGEGASVGPASPRIKWTMSITSGNSAAAVIGTGNRIYVVDGQTLYALNLDNGQVIWSYQADGLLRSPAVAANGRIYVTSDTGTLYSLDESGSKIWSVRYATQWTNQGVTIAPDGTVYFGASDGWLYAVNSDSTLKWKYSIGSWINGVPALDNLGNIYIGSSTKSVYALRPNGTLIWSFDTLGYVDASPAIDEARNAVYVGSVNGKLYSLNRLTGSKRWEYQTSASLYRVAAIGSDGTVYQGSNDGSFYAISSAGTKLWSIVLDGAVNGLPSIDAGNTLYIGTQSAALYAISNDGTIRWKQPINGDVYGAALIVDGILYVGSSHRLVAIESDATTTPTVPVSVTTTTPIPTTPAITTTPTVSVSVTTTPIPTTPAITSTPTPTTPPPTATPLPNVTTVPPAQDAVLTTTAGAQFSFPARTFTETTLVTFTVVPTTAAPATGNFLFLDKVYEVQATGSDATPVQPNQPYTIRISYDESALGGIDETTLKLYYWNGTQWVVESTSAVDTVNNVLIATPNHFSTWAVGVQTRFVYLPIVLKPVSNGLTGE